MLIKKKPSERADTKKMIKKISKYLGCDENVYLKTHKESHHKFSQSQIKIDESDIEWVFPKNYSPQTSPLSTPRDKKNNYNDYLTNPSQKKNSISAKINELRLKKSKSFHHNENMKKLFLDIDVVHKKKRKSSHHDLNDVN
jgi:hypothetical protein